ncbi:MAG TPA: zinc-dependent metalloprotease, partial [Mycobacterium sp.]|nr:zinc-dependent metalloprotease [Mycobacterium sp.]
MQYMSHTTTSKLTVGRAVDWNFAAAVGAKLVRPGPAATEYTRRQVIDQLTEASRSAELPVREVTGLIEGGEVPEARIVDRTQWIRAATQSMRVMTGGADSPKSLIAGRITGAQTGAVLAFVSSGILGQYDPFGPDGGELLLVYPNVIAVERQLRVQPYDFRLWVCLHEVTHRVQFRANPWLADHMKRSLAVLTEETPEDISEVIGRLAEFVRERRDSVNGADAQPNSSGMIGVLRAVQSEPQRRALDQLLVLGTLLEGHADHVMDAVGPAVVPSVATIRRRFDERRRRKQPPLQRLVRALLGFDAKLSQYTRGKAFVDHVVSRVGMARFNAVWSGPETLP